MVCSCHNLLVATYKMSNHLAHAVMAANQCHIEATKKSVNVATVVLKWAKNDLEAAEAALQSARDKFQEARMNLSDAEADLKDAEERSKISEKMFEVITLDDDDETVENKKRSMNSDTEATSKHLKKVKQGFIGIPDKVFLSGCGLSEVDGEYHRCGLGPSYRKHGSWRTKTSDFYINYKFDSKKWTISVISKNGVEVDTQCIYCASGTWTSLPEQWECSDFGSEPAPGYEWWVTKN